MVNSKKKNEVKTYSIETNKVLFNNNSIMKIKLFNSDCIQSYLTYHVNNCTNIKLSKLIKVFMV